MTPLGELGRIMEVTVDFVFVFVVRVLGAKYCRTHGASKMFNMVFAFQCRNIRAAEGTAARMTEKLQSSEVVSLTQRILLGFIF